MIYNARCKKIYPRALPENYFLPISQDTPSETFTPARGWSYWVTYLPAAFCLCVFSMVKSGFA
jgi:hypothetical protein